MTKEAEKIQTILDQIEMFERMKEENGELTADEQTELDILKDTPKGMGQICSECEGDGRSVDYKRINPQSIDQPYTNCSYCSGRGVL